MCTKVGRKEPRNTPKAYSYVSLLTPGTRFPQGVFFSSSTLLEEIALQPELTRRLI